MVVASNLFGDILTDLSRRGHRQHRPGELAPTSTRRGSSRACSSRSTAQRPDIAGKGIANPLAAILSAALMLDHLGLEKSAEAVRDAVASVLTLGR